jgi:hypothetical protein
LLPTVEGPRIRAHRAVDRRLDHPVGVPLGMSNLSLGEPVLGWRRVTAHRTPDAFVAADVPPVFVLDLELELAVGRRALLVDVALLVTVDGDGNRAALERAQFSQKVVEHRTSTRHQDKEGHRFPVPLDLAVTSSSAAEVPASAP